MNARNEYRNLDRQMREAARDQREWHREWMGRGDNEYREDAIDRLDCSAIDALAHWRAYQAGGLTQRAGQFRRMLARRSFRLAVKHDQRMTPDRFLRLCAPEVQDYAQFGGLAMALDPWA